MCHPPNTMFLLISTPTYARISRSQPLFSPSFPPLSPPPSPSYFNLASDLRYFAYGYACVRVWVYPGVNCMYDADWEASETGSSHTHSPPLTVAHAFYFLLSRNLYASGGKSGTSCYYAFYCAPLCNISHHQKGGQGYRQRLESRLTNPDLNTMTS